MRNVALGSNSTATSQFVQPDPNAPLLLDTTYAGAVVGGTVVAQHYQAPNQGTQRTFDHKGTDAGRLYPGETLTVCGSVNTGAAITCGASFAIRVDN